MLYTPLMSRQSTLIQISQSSLPNVKTLGGGKNVVVLIHRDPLIYSI